VRFLRGFGRFWYAFVIGDDWKIAAAVAATVSLGAVVAATAEPGTSWIAPLVVVTLGAAFAIALVIEVRRG
jgi:hypothetical protein